MDDYNEDVMHDLCCYLIEAGSYSQAVKTLRRFIAEPPVAPWAHVMLGKCLHELGHNEIALESLWHALDVTPHLIDARFHAGLAAKALGDYKQAIGHFKEVVLLNTNDARTYNLLGECSQALEERGNASLFYAQACRLAPDFETPVENLRKLWEEEERNVFAQTSPTLSDAVH